MHQTPALFRQLALVAAGLALCASHSFAAPTGAMADAQARYRQDMALCSSGQSNQSPQTCRLEARNALAEARRGGLDDAPDSYTGNTLRRCAAHEALDRAACEARMRGEGTVTGTVRGGGILRESVTVVPTR